jgi:hypothetical protein
MKRTLSMILVISLFSGLAGWLSYRYFVVVPIDARWDGQIDASAVAEMEDFNQPQFRHVILAYLQNLSDYGHLKMQSISVGSSIENIAEKLGPILDASLSRDKSTSLIVSQNGADLKSSLCRHVALLLGRCAGMPAEEYIEELGSAVRFRLPENIARMKYFHDEFDPDGSIPPADSDQATLRQFFIHIYSVEQQFRSGSNQIVAWSNDPNGFIALLDEPRPGTALNELHGSFELVEGRLSPDQILRFRGKMAQGSLICTFLPAVSATASAGIIRAQVGVIVRTKGNDYYPIHFHSYYDPAEKRWHLMYVNRNGSPRMGTSPSLVF